MIYFVLSATKMIRTGGNQDVALRFTTMPRLRLISRDSRIYTAPTSAILIFPISRYGERIKFVDKNGKEKFTVMPIDGKEPRSVYSTILNEIILVDVDNEKYDAINTTGKWVIYPEWTVLNV